MNYLQLDKKTTNQAGFSLLEMLIAVSLFIIVTGSIYTLLELGRSDRNRTSRRGDTQKNARIAMYLIGRDVMNAGLGYHKVGGLVPDDFLANRLSVPIDVNATRDTLTSVACGNNVFTNKFLPSGQKTDAIAFIYRDLDFNGGKPVVISDEVGTSSNKKVVFQLPTPSPTPSVTPSATPYINAATNFSNLNNNDLFMVETKTSQIIGIVTAKDATTYRVEIDNTDNLGLNQERNKKDASNNFIGSLFRKCTSLSDTNCTTYDGIVLKKIEMVSYQVTNDGTLLRTIYGNNTSGAANEQIQQRAIAYGVQDFQIRYQMLDGTIVDDPVAGVDGIRGVNPSTGVSDDNPTNMNNVRHVSISLTVSSTEVDEKSGDAEVIVLNSTFALRNMTYDDK